MTRTCQATKVKTRQKREYGVRLHIRSLPVFPIPPSPGINGRVVAVLTKILFGSLHVESYDLVGRSGDEAGEKEPTTLSRTTSAEAGARTASGGSGRRHEAVSSPPRSVGAETPSFLLTPSKGNVHAFKAPVTCAVLDILVRRMKCTCVL